MPGKSAVGSLTIMSSVVGFLALLAQLLGYTLSPDDQAMLVNFIQSGFMAVTTLIGLVSTLLAMWGRVRASKQITSVLPKGN